jgi:polyhydroxyalkanoate synthase subunit PhaC
MHAQTFPSFASLGVTVLKNMDRSRQARGKMLERAGYGPQETAFTVVHSEAGLNLRRYGPGQSEGAAVLLIPGPIKRSYIWDLAPGISVVQRWIEQGYRVYLAEWTPIEQARDDHDFGLDDYADRLLANCQQAIEADCGQPTITVVGHSLGGILAAVYSCLHPDKVDATILLESPLHFEQASCCYRKLIDSTPHARQLAASFKQVPGAFLNLMSAIAEPQAFQWERLLDRYQSLFNPRALQTHMQVERWTHDEFALPGRLFTDLVEQLYRNDEFMQGTLTVSGRQIGPHDLRAPLLAVVDARSKVIPEAALLPFYQCAGSAHKELLYYKGDVGVNLQHVGVLVGDSAHNSIWPQIHDWLRQLNVQASAPCAEAGPEAEAGPAAEAGMEEPRGESKMGDDHP